MGPGHAAWCQPGRRKLLNGILAVDGYTGYLVIAYGVTALVVVGNLVAARRQFRQVHRRLREQLERRSGRRPVPGSSQAS
ncbi:MAG: heme exporter protein CcmD, partial [Halioglobus sp.]|nr:heme exporter protein CcmD [Halioglobus sp.]